MRVSSTGATPSHLEQGGAPSSCSPVVAARNVRGVGGLVSLAWGASMQSMPAMRRCACSRAGARLARIWAHFSASRLRAAARRASRYAVHAFAPGGGAVWLQLGSGFTRSVRTSGLGLCYLRVALIAVDDRKFPIEHVAVDRDLLALQSPRDLVLLATDVDDVIARDLAQLGDDKMLA